MKKPGIALGILLGALVGLLLWKNSGPSEPVYEGKPFSRWLQGHVASSAADPPYGSPGWQKADQVLRHIGTNGIPTLLKMIEAKDPPALALKGLEWARNRRLLFTSYRYASTRNEEARYGFEVLGASAASAVPDLIKIYQRNVSPASKRCTASALGSIGHAAQPALPALLKDFADPDRQVRFDAVTAVIFIRGEPKVLIPALVSMLKDPMLEIRGNAAVALSMLGERARTAVPALVGVLRAFPPNDPQKELVETSLWRIAPERVGKPLVVEEATPMIADGVTTEALDIQFKGERRTVLPSGRTVPCEAQLWSQEPRGSFTLFRVANRPEQGGHCLGEFEVVGVLPSPTDVNVSLFCVIADGTIFLCGRDNIRNEFVEIRRLK